MQQEQANIHLLIHSTSIFDFNTYTIESIIVSPQKTYNYGSIDDFVNILPVEKQVPFFPLKPQRAAAYVSQLVELSNANGKGDDFIKAEWLRYLQKTFLTIAQKNSLKIYIKIANGINKTINKAFVLQPKPLEIRFILSLKNEVYGVDIFYFVNKQWLPAIDCNRHQFILLHHTEMYIIPYSDTTLLNWLEKVVLHKKIKDYDTFNQNYLSKIEVKHTVDRTAVFAPVSITSNLICKVHVRETLGAYLLIEPKVYYDHLSFSDIHTNNNAEYNMVHQGVTYNIARQLQEENEFYLFVQNFHDNFKKQMNGYFQLNFGEAGKKQWFYKFYFALLEKQIDVIGIDLLHHFRYTSEKPQTAVTVINEASNKITLQFEVQFGKELIPLLHLQKALRNQQHSLPLKDNSIAVLPQEWLEQYATIVKHGTIVNNQLVVNKNFIVSQQLQILPNEKAVVEHQILPDDWKKNWLQWQQYNHTALFQHTVNATLRDYQQKGMEWLYLLSQIGAGALLADDMGLGKTLQTIAYLQYYCHLHPQAKHLVIAPASLLYNWQKEIEKFTPNLKIAVHYGTQRNWDTTLQEQPQIVLTTYSIGRNDIEQLQSQYWDTIILDESHNIKNPDALTSKAIVQMEAGFKICLSGTPIMNNTMDLYAQFNFLLPGFFYNKSFFKQEYAVPIDEEKDDYKLAVLQKLTNPYILRRTKQQVATELPPKTESIIWCTLGESQRVLYENIKENNWTNLQTSIANEGLQKSRFQILTTLLRLRQLCDSPLLLPSDMQTTAESAKVDILVEEIKNNTGNSKVVVFSQFVKMIDLIKEAFDENNISYQSFDGSTNAQERTDLINQFQDVNNDTKVFLISLKAGAVGITLTEAEYVYLVDPWWNKAIESQAIDRIHRIGQTKHIFAYKMICTNTVEEKIVQLQQRKAHLSDSLIQIEEDFVKQLTEEDLQFIFS
jgi:superfamily II DNA or RNA helicase